MTFSNDFHSQTPNFAAFASLREIFRDLVAALPRWALRELRGKIYVLLGFRSAAPAHYGNVTPADQSSFFLISSFTLSNTIPNEIAVSAHANQSPNRT